MKLLTKDNLRLVIELAIVVLLLLMLISKKERPVDHTVEIKALEKVSQAIERERDIYRAWKDEAVAELQRKDSLLQTQVKQTIIKYEKIPVTVGNYNNEELRRAVENY